MTASIGFIAANLPLATDAESSFIAHLGVTAILAVLPFVVIACSSFIKIALILAILRSALGASNVPPNSVLTALAAVLSMFVMAPVAMDVADSLEKAASEKAAPENADPLGIVEARRLYRAASPPLIEFLRLNTPSREVDFFKELSGSPQPNPGLRVLMPAFAAGEMVEGFKIGFLLFIPFLVIDLIVSTVLLSLGMNMMSPTSVSLPLKLLLFVAVDGWHLLLNGVLTTYSV